MVVYTSKDKHCNIRKSCVHFWGYLGVPALQRPSSGILIRLTSSCSFCLSVVVISRQTAWPESKPFYQKPLCRGWRDSEHRIQTPQTSIIASKHPHVRCRYQNKLVFDYKVFWQPATIICSILKKSQAGVKISS